MQDFSGRERLADAAGTRVLMATGVGGHPIAPVLDGLVGSALWMRGADVSYLLCDHVLPACEMCQYVSFPRTEHFVQHGPQRRLCSPCFDRGQRLLHPLPPELKRYSAFVSAPEIEAAKARTNAFSIDNCFAWEEEGISLGEHVRAAVIRFFGKADLSSEPSDLVLAVARRYAAGASVSARVFARALDAFDPDVVVAHHGIYVPQGVLGEVARQRAVRVVNWGTAYRDRTVIYSHDDTYHRTFLHEPPVWDERELLPEQEDRLMTFLARRRRGEGDWRWVTPEAALRYKEQERADIVQETGIDVTRPVVGLLTNVLWDAQLYYEGHAFTDMLDWLWFTIDFFAERPDQQLLIRIHPHEVKHGNRQPVGAEIAHRYPSLPENIHVVGHDSRLNTYALMALCRSVLIYGTKTGVELAPLGQPVIVAADAWIRGKNLTFDASTKSEYLALLEQAASLPKLDDDAIARARRYAFHYFFRRMIPLSSLEPDRDEVTVAVSSLSELAPGHDPGLDVICGGILTGAEFVFDA